MQTLALNVHKGYGDCEDCGGYHWGRAEFVIDGRTVAHVYHDGHLGGGTWSGKLSQLYLWALGLLGYSVTFTNLAGGERLPLSPVMHERQDSDYVMVPMPPQVTLEVPAGLHHPDQWEIESAQENGEPAPQPRLLTASEIEYDDSFEASLLAILKSVATVGVRVEYSED